MATNDNVAAPERNVSASCPAIVPSTQPVIVATPSASAVTGAGAFPALALSSTIAPATGFSKASVTRAVTVPVTASPARPLNTIGVSGTKRVADPATPVAVMTSGATPDTDTVIVFVPARGPSVHAPTEVGELAVRPGVPAILPPPDETVTVNFTSANGGAGRVERHELGRGGKRGSGGSGLPVPGDETDPGRFDRRTGGVVAGGGPNQHPAATTRDACNDFT